MYKPFSQRNWRRAQCLRLTLEGWCLTFFNVWRTTGYRERARAQIRHYRILHVGSAYLHRKIHPHFVDVDEFRKRKGKQTEIDQTEIPRPHSIADKLLHHEASCNIDTVDSEKAEDVFLVRAKK